MKTTSCKIINRIRRKKRGWVFSAKDFLDLGCRTTVYKTLSRLSDSGMIRKISRGLYDFPKPGFTMSVLPPSPDKIAKAIGVKTGKEVFASGALAANLMGFSTQVPAKHVYLTNGPSCVKRISDRNVILKHAKVPLFPKLSNSANLAIQGLSYLGKKYIDDKIIAICASKLSNSDKVALRKTISKIPGWIADVIYKIQN